MILLKKFYKLILLSIACSAFAQQVDISWIPNTDSDLAGYKLYYGKSKRFYKQWLDIGNVDSYRFTTFPDTGKIYLALTAYDSTGNESLFSNEVTFYVYIDSLLDKQFQLLPNHPNPFNPVTSIPYHLYKRVHVKLAIYDILGREVELLVDEEQEAGHYISRWNGRSREGHELPNGVYLARLIIGDFCLTRKLTFLK